MTTLQESAEIFSRKMNEVSNKIREVEAMLKSHPLKVGFECKMKSERAEGYITDCYLRWGPYHLEGNRYRLMFFMDVYEEKDKPDEEQLFRERDPKPLIEKSFQIRVIMVKLLDKFVQKFTKFMIKKQEALLKGL